MPPRTRRSVAAAAAAAALVADMQMDSDAEREEEEQVDVVVEDDEQEVEDAEEEEEEDPNGETPPEEEEEDDPNGETPPEEEEEDDPHGETPLEEEDESEGELEKEEVPVPMPPVQPRLKITLRLPANTASSNGTDAETDYAAFKRTPKRRAKAKVIQDADLESEDPPSVSDTDEEASLHAPTHSTGTPTTSTKPMTTRQAVLASVVDPSHVFLNEGTRSKKQPLNETELALRREETARKRKNLSEKKLEDEKAETINRLLKKQSRPKNKRTNTLDDRSPMPLAKAKTGDDDAEADDDDDAMDVVEQPEEVKPVMYRWVSSLREVPGESGERKVEMGITFSVPENILPRPSNEMDIAPDEDLKKIRAGRGPGVCAVEGCGKPRKYRLPRDWTVGACDSTHLRVLAK